MRILHVSDLHFGRSSIPAQVTALEGFMARETLDAIVISGDLSQRTRRHEFASASAFVRRCEERAPTLVVPGNHDCAWWGAVFGIGDSGAMFSRYRELIDSELQPVIQIPGATIVGINSAHGIQSYTLTMRPRDLSVVGAVLPHQWERARIAFSLAPESDLKVLVVHHNILRGKRSNRWGLATRALGVVDAASTGADVVCCGHDHEERVEEVESTQRRFVVSTAGTLTNRVRGGRPGSWNLIEREPDRLSVSLFEWNELRRDFGRARVSTWARPAV